MFIKSYIKPKTVLSKLKKLKPLYDSIEVAWKTNTEKAIINASAEIRKIPDWADKLSDEAFRKQWFAEMEDKNPLAKKQESYVVSELFYYAKLQEFVRNSGSDAKLSTVEMLWYTDVPENGDLAQEFKSSLSKMLESIPKAHYYRPDLDRPLKPFVQKIVDPSLYSLVYKSTPILAKPMTSPLEALSLSSFGTVPGSIDAWRQAVCDLNASMAKKRKGSIENPEQSDTTANSFVPFDENYLGLVDATERHWLPTDIYVNKDGSVDFRSYINNIHPVEHSGMYTAISKVLSRTIPLLEQVLTDWEHPRDLRIPYSYEDCLEFPIDHPSKLGGKFDMYSNEFDSEKYDEAMDQWRESIVDTTQKPAVFVEPKRPLAAYSLRNKNLQVVIEITDRHMPPLSTTAAENIIATAVYYYEIEDEGSYETEFYEGIQPIDDYINSAYDLLVHKILYEGEYVSKGLEFFQQAGTIDIKQGQIICYPNIYQRERYPVYKGLKRLTMYFVDPSVRVVSTAIVPPQQKDWWTKTVSSVPSKLCNLPPEIQEMVFKCVDSSMSFEKACEVSEQPNGSRFYDCMYERFTPYIHVGDINYYEPGFL